MSHRWKLESCDPGMQNCALVVESKHAKESHLVSLLTVLWIMYDYHFRNRIFKLNLAKIHTIVHLRTQYTVVSIICRSTEKCIITLGWMSNYKRIYIVICVNEHRYQALFQWIFLTSTTKDNKQAWIKNSVELIGTSIYGIRWVSKFENYKYYQPIMQS